MLEEISLSVLFGTLVLLVFLSAFFSSSETAMIALNRYRLRHLAQEGKRSAIISEKLLSRPDRLIGLILFCNNLVNFIAATIATLIGLRLLGELGVALAPFILLAVFLIFAEVMPKTIAAFYPERIAFPASYVLTILLKVASPAVWLINWISNGLLGVIGIKTDEQEDTPLTREELRTIVREAGTLISQRNQRMLISILDLENVTVDDIMVPRNEIVAVDIDDPVEKIIQQLKRLQHTRIPVYQSNIDNIIGIIHVRRVPRILNQEGNTSIDSIKNIVTECYFVPKGTPLHIQMTNFQRNRRRFGIVVDEYGVIQGLVTLEDILEEIVGEFTTDIQSHKLEIQRLNDGSNLVDCTIHIRELNRQLKWHLPTDGPKTLNGLILEQLEYIPETGTSLKISDYLIEITDVSDSAVKMARVRINEQKAETAD
ncbi:MAG: HlyC/CorC family transporter [Pseudomonadota bacterium]